MTALSADALRDSRELGAKYKLPVAASTTIYKGSLVMMAAGYAEPAAADAANDGCWGVAVLGVDNSAGSAGDVYVLVQEGEYLFAGDTLAAATSTGHTIYADDDNTVDETQATNCPVAGKCTEFVSATQAWVAVGKGLVD